MAQSPAVILYDSNGVAMAVQNGVAIPAGTRGLLMSGQDIEGQAKFARTDEDGNVSVGAWHLSGFAPDPKNHLVRPSRMILDDERNLQTRSRVLTDEGSFRDDFTGSSIYKNGTGTITVTNGSQVVVGVGTIFTTELATGMWIKLQSEGEAQLYEILGVISDTVLQLQTVYGGTSGSGAFNYSNWKVVTASGGSVAVASSEMTVTPGLTNGNSSYITRVGDYLPFTLNFTARISQRIANQEGIVGFVDDPATPVVQAVLLFDGTDNTLVKFKTASSANVADIQTTTFDLRNLNLNYTTAVQLGYEINISARQAVLLIDGVVVASHRLSLPGPYEVVQPVVMIRNTAGVGSNTSLTVHQITFITLNELEVGTMLEGVVIAGRDTDGVTRQARMDSRGRLVVISPFTGAGFSDGRATIAVATPTAVNNTAVTEQTTNAQRSVVSSSASDAAAGTGARTVRITYYTAAMVGPYTETLTLNGTTPVNTVNTNICFVERIEVLTVGSTGSNVGTISLRAAVGGGGATIGSIAATQNQTFWALHYVRSGFTCHLTGVMGAIPGTTSNSCRFFLRSRNPTQSDSADRQITDQFSVNEGGTGSFLRQFATPVDILGPARIQGFAQPFNASSREYALSFEYYED